MADAPAKAYETFDCKHCRAVKDPMHRCLECLVRHRLESTSVRGMMFWKFLAIKDSYTSTCFGVTLGGFHWNIWHQQGTILRFTREPTAVCIKQIFHCSVPALGCQKLQQLYSVHVLHPTDNTDCDSKSIVKSLQLTVAKLKNWEPTLSIQTMMFQVIMLRLDMMFCDWQIVSVMLFLDLSAGERRMRLWQCWGTHNLQDFRSDNQHPDALFIGDCNKGVRGSSRLAWMEF